MEVASTFIVAGDMESFNQTAFKSGLASFFQVSEDAVSLTANPASIEVDVRVVTTSATHAKQMASTLQAGPSEVLSSALGVTIESISDLSVTEHVVAAQSPPTSLTALSMPESTLTALILALVLLASFIFCALGRRMKKRREQRRVAFVQDEKRSTEIDAFDIEPRGAYAKAAEVAVTKSTLSKAKGASLRVSLGAKRTPKRYAVQTLGSDEAVQPRCDADPFEADSATPNQAFVAPAPAAEVVTTTSPRSDDKEPAIEGAKHFVCASIRAPRGPTETSSPVLCRQPLSDAHRPAPRLAQTTPGTLPDFTDSVHSAPEAQGLPVGRAMAVARYRKAGHSLTTQAGAHVPVASEVASVSESEGHQGRHRAPPPPPSMIGRQTNATGKYRAPPELPSALPQETDPPLQARHHRLPPGLPSHCRHTSGATWRNRVPPNRKDADYDWALDW